jgi:hypothetical protein
MAKTLRTSGDYTIKTGTGAGGSNTVFFGSKTTRVVGDLVVDGTRTELNTATMSIEDKFIEVNRGNSTADTEDSGIFFNRGSSNHGLLYWDAGDDDFQLGTSTNAPSVTAITNITYANIKVATTPAHANHAASKQYVDSTAASSIQIASDDSSVITLGGSQDTLQLLGGTNISNTAVVGADSITFNLNNDLTAITSITSDASNGDLTLITNGTGDVVIDDTLTFSAAASTPSHTAITKIYNKTAGGGGTGLFFINSNIGSGTEGELISKSKATALAIALG